MEVSSAAAAAVQCLAAAAPNLRLRPEWVTAQPAVTGPEASNALLRRLVASDLRDACDGSLPPGLDRLHNIFVEGAHLLQLLQAVDVAHPSLPEVEGEQEASEPAEGAREGFAAAFREVATTPMSKGPVMMKVCLTDGVQAVCGIERRPIRALREAEPGAKLVLGNRPLLRRGLLLLEPRHLEVLGPKSQPAAPALGAQERPQGVAAVAGLAIAPPHGHSTTSAEPAAAPLPETAPTSSGASAHAAMHNPTGVAHSATSAFAASPAVLGNSVSSCASSFGAHAVGQQGVDTLLQLGSWHPSAPAGLEANPSLVQPGMSCGSCVGSAPSPMTNQWRPGAMGQSLLAARSAQAASAAAATPAAAAAAAPPERDQRGMNWHFSQQGSGASQEMTLRSYVCDAVLTEDGLHVRLCDGVSVSQPALMQVRLLLELFGVASPEEWPRRAQGLHGFFTLRGDSNSGDLSVLGFRRGPLQSEVEELLRELGMHSLGTALPIEVEP